MSALLPVVEGSFDCNRYVHGSPTRRKLTLVQDRSLTTTPMLSPLSAANWLDPVRIPIRVDETHHHLDP